MRKLIQNYGLPIAVIILLFTSCGKDDGPNKTNKKLLTIITSELTAVDPNVASGVDEVRLNDKTFPASQVSEGCKAETFLEPTGLDVKYFFTIAKTTSGEVIDTCQGTFASALLNRECNEVSVVNYNATATLKINGNLATPVIKDGGVTNNGVYGQWVLTGSGGDLTELAVGSITGEGNSRVFMCEKKGTGFPVLYKGTLDGSTIKWDADHGLSDYTLKVSNDKLIVDCGPCLPTTFVPGAWGGGCGEL